MMRGRTSPATEVVRWKQLQHRDDDIYEVQKRGTHLRPLPAYARLALQSYVGEANERKLLPVELDVLRW